MNRLTNILIVSSIFLLIILGSIESNLFVKRGQLYYQQSDSLTWNDFRGYPNYLSQYAAAISSYFDYSSNANLDTITVNSYMNKHHSWVSSYYTDSDYILRHELYHFKITELHARKLRKWICENRDQITGKRLEKQYRTLTYELDLMQDIYDSQTDHGALLEKQKDWEYIVDSLVVMHEIFSEPVLTKNNDHPSNGVYYYSRIDYDNQGKIFGKYRLDRQDAIQQRHYRINYINGKIRSIEHFNKDVPEIDQDLKAFRTIFSYDKNKEVRRFFKENYNPAENYIGVYITELTYSDQFIVICSYGKDYEPIINSEGVHKTVWELDYNRRRSNAKFYDLEDNQIINNEGFLNIQFTYDQNNHRTGMYNYSNDNELLEDKSGVAYYNYEYDYLGNIIKVAAFNSENKPVPYNSNIAKSLFAYDVFGNIIMQQYFDKNGKVIIEDNAAIYYNKYDKLGNLINIATYGTNKNLIINNAGLGRIEHEYDSLGRVAKQWNFDAYDSLLNSNDGYCHAIYEYSDNNELISQINYSRKGDSLKFFQKVLIERDSLGRQVANIYLNENEELNNEGDSIAKVLFEYDQNGNINQIAYYNCLDSLQALTDGVALYKYYYNQNNQKIRTEYYDKNQLLHGNAQGIAIDEFAYNAEGQLIKRSFYDKHGKLTKNQFGVEQIKLVYRNGNKVTEEFYYDFNDKPITCNEGYASVLNQFDNRGNHIEQRYRDEYGNLVESVEGYSIIRNIYDDLNRLVGQSYYNSDDLSVSSTNNISIIQFKYDRNNNLILETYYDENNMLTEDSDSVAFRNWVYDRNGNVISSYVFGADHDNLEYVNYGEFYYNNSSVSNSGNFTTTFADNKRTQTTYYENGQIKDQCTYIDGKLEGTYLSWYETGELQSSIQYKNGKRHGKMIEYYITGEKSRELIYENNIFVSETEWYKNGQVKFAMIDGESVFYNENGEII